MKILFDVVHPAQALFFVRTISALTRAGHHIIVTSREKDVTIDILDEYNIKHTVLTQAAKTRIGLALEMASRDIRLITIIRKERPQLIVGKESACAAQAAYICRIPSVLFDDSDEASLQKKLTFPFATEIYTDMHYGPSLGPKHRTYSSISPLAYLHPKRYRAKDEVIGQYIHKDKPTVFIRLVSWTASHDYGQSGIRPSDLEELIAYLSEKATILISSEVGLPQTLEPFRIQLRTSMVHSVLSSCDLYIGESATMATEAIVLGVPAIYFSSLETWYIRMLANKGMLYHITAFSTLISLSMTILNDNTTKQKLRESRDNYVMDCDDIDLVIQDAILKYRPPIPDGSNTDSSSLNS